MTEICICVKGTSLRCPNKNEILLPYTLKQINQFNLPVNIISDSEKFLDIADKYNCNYIIDKNTKGSEIGCLCRFIESKELDDIILLPVTQPLRDSTLIKRILNLDIKNIDFVTSYINISDRRNFYINDENKFIYPELRKEGIACKYYKMLDGAIYRINSNYLKQIYNSEDIIKSFWTGNFITIQNYSLFCDIDTKEDLIQFTDLFNNI